MTFILDTNVLSAVRKTDRFPAVEHWLRAQSDEALFVSVISIGEIERGICLQEAKNPGFAADLRSWLAHTEAVFADRILPFSTQDARTWGALSARLGHDGADLMIAATALNLQATVVTRNTAHFGPTGVGLLNPFEPA